MRTLIVVSLFAILASLAIGCANGFDGAEEIASIGAALDDWHRAAAAADEARYFSHLADDAIFLGTDATERWDVRAFREYVHPYFSKGKGWTYVPGDRHVRLAPGGAVAWVDERLGNEKYGELRGTGVLRKDGGAWKIVHYSMSFPVPNGAAARVVAEIRAGGAR